MELRILAIFFTLTGARQDQLEGPENTLSVVGANVALRCVSPSRNCRQIEWQKYVPDANGMNVFSDRAGIYVVFRDRYSVDNSSGCHLVIKNVNLTDAGRFVCRAFISSQQTEKAASLIILIRNVTLSPLLPNYSPEKMITCTAMGHPSPTFKWQEMENNGTWMDIQNTSQFVLMNSSLKQYRCLATNVVRGRSYNSASHVFRINNLGFETNDPGDGAGIAMGVGIGFIAAVVLATVVLAILIKLGYIDVHPRPIINECFDGRQDMKSSSQQVKAAQPSNQNVVEQESAYAGLGEDRDVSEYESLELRQKAKPKKTSIP